MSESTERTVMFWFLVGPIGAVLVLGLLAGVIAALGYGVATAIDWITRRKAERARLNRLTSENLGLRTLLTQSRERTATSYDGPTDCSVHIDPDPDPSSYDGPGYGYVCRSKERS